MIKKIIVSVICIELIFISTIYADKISNYIVGFISGSPAMDIKPANEYVKTDEFMYVKNTKEFTPYSMQDLKNIIYTVINNGWKDYTFYCPKEYTNCIKDISDLSVDEVTLTHINNYVHPYNSFTQVQTQITDDGEISLTIIPVYSDSQIEAIDTEVNRLMDIIIKEENSDYENIKAIHDYIINNTKYDQLANTNESTYASAIAYGTLFDHYATCNGYTDTMAIFLTKMGIPNYKIATTEEDVGTGDPGHVWNAVYIGGKWLHLDLTWDDPVSNDGFDYLYHKYFLVTTNEMKKADSGSVEIKEHQFRDDIYLEFNDRK